MNKKISYVVKWKMKAGRRSTEFSDAEFACAFAQKVSMSGFKATVQKREIIEKVTTILVVKPYGGKNPST
ncbi:MAG: hypothetical protein ACPGYT_11745 [Nitrospirales bacterium]